MTTKLTSTYIEGHVALAGVPPYGRHDLYALAEELIHPRNGKYDLVRLVAFLLEKMESGMAAEAELSRVVAKHERDVHAFRMERIDIENAYPVIKQGETP